MCTILRRSVATVVVKIDSMYIILRGSVGIYRLMEDVASTQQPPPAANKDKEESIRQQLGEKVAGLGDAIVFQSRIILNNISNRLIFIRFNNFLQIITNEAKQFTVWSYNY